MFTKVLYDVRYSSIHKSLMESLFERILSGMYFITPGFFLCNFPGT